MWLNLHQALLYEAAPQLPAGSPRRPAQGIMSPPGPSWRDAVAHYREVFAGQHYLFDDGLVAVNRAAADAGNAATLTGDGIDSSLRLVLAAAAREFEKGTWPRLRDSNQIWIDELKALVERHGAAVAERLTGLFATPWPDTPIEVQVAARVTGPGAAYTTLDPILITVSSADQRQQGEAALEIIFHEAAHGLIRRVSDEIVAECKRAGKAVPRTLWHAVLFYTVGEVVRDALGPTYKPYAYRQGMYERVPRWGDYERLFERFWGPYLRGETSRAEALRGIVAGLPATR